MMIIYCYSCVHTRVVVAGKFYKIGVLLYWMMKKKWTQDETGNALKFHFFLLSGVLPPCCTCWIDCPGSRMNMLFLTWYLYCLLTMLMMLSLITILTLSSFSPPHLYFFTTRSWKCATTQCNNHNHTNDTTNLISSSSSSFLSMSSGKWGLGMVMMIRSLVDGGSVLRKCRGCGLWLCSLFAAAGVKPCWGTTLLTASRSRQFVGFLFFLPNQGVNFYFEFLPAKSRSRFLFWISSRQIQNQGDDEMKSKSKSIDFLSYHGRHYIDSTSTLTSNGMLHAHHLQGKMPMTMTLLFSP